MTQEQIDWLKKQPDRSALIEDFIAGRMASQGIITNETLRLERTLRQLEADRERAEAATEIDIVGDGQKFHGPLDFTQEYWWNRSGGQASGEWWHQNRQHFKTAENGRTPENPLDPQPIDDEGKLLKKIMQAKIDEVKRIDKEIEGIKKAILATLSLIHI